MSTLKQRHKLEQKALNQECDAKLVGKKGSERTAAMKQIELLKQALFLKQQKEEEEEKEVERLAALENEEVEIAESIQETNGATAPKLSKAREKAKRKEEKERNEKVQREADALARGPTVRDREMDALAMQLSKLGLLVKQIPPDGNCMYAAIRDQLIQVGSDPLSVSDLRQLAADFIVQHADDFEAFLPETETLASFVKKLLVNGEWGGELELRALSLALKRQLWIHRIHAPIRKMGEEEDFAPPILHLTFHEHQFSTGEHYNSTTQVVL